MAGVEGVLGQRSGGRRVEGVADIDSNICALSVQRSVLNYV